MATLDDVARDLRKAQREYARNINRALEPIAKSMKASALVRQAAKFRNPTGYTAAHTFADVRSGKIRLKVVSRGGFFQERGYRTRSGGVEPPDHFLRDAFEAHVGKVPKAVDAVVIPALLGPGGGRG